MKRVLCVWLPRWPIQRLRHARPELREQPLVLYAPAGRGKLQVTACSPAAVRQGVKPGMPLAEARALGVVVRRGQRPLHFELHDRLADCEALRKLALSCQKFTPITAVEEAEHPDSLLLDITGCTHLFGGEEALAGKVVSELADRDYRTKVAIADTIGAAWALAHHSPRTTHHSPLTTLPIEALRLSSQVVELLHEFDIRRIGQLLELPRADLASRFQIEVVHRLDQALGNLPELLTGERTEEPVQVSWSFEPPAADRRMIATVLELLLERVLEQLRPRQIGIQKLLCSLQTTVREPICIHVGLLEASGSLGHLMELVRLHLERVQIPAAVSEVSMRVAAAVPLGFHQEQLFEGEDRQQHLPALLERLAGRLGEKAVLRGRLFPDPQPEFAYRFEPWLTSEKDCKLQIANCKLKSNLQSAICNLQSSLRPPCLAGEPIAIVVVAIVPGGPPLRFQWRGQSYTVAHCWGPERIETGWWRDRDVRRDYYLVETTAGNRFWLFRTIADESWFLHGMFA